MIELFTEIEAIKLNFNNLAMIVENCCQSSNRFKSKTNKIIISSNLEFNESIEVKLFQNTPNSFSENTKTGYYLLEDVQKAMICIYDSNETQLKCDYKKNEDTELLQS